MTGNGSRRLGCEKLFMPLSAHGSVVGRSEGGLGPSLLDKEPLPKLAELKRFDSHSCPGSADRFSEIANRMVNMGLMLCRKQVQLFVPGPTD